MNVALVSVFPRDPRRVVGGVEAASKYLADELVRLPGMNVSVIVPGGAEANRTTVEEWGALRIYRLGRSGVCRRLPGTVYDLASGRRQLDEQLERLAPDVTHFQGNAFLAGVHGGRSVLTIHGIAERDALWDRRRGASRWLKRRLLTATEGYGRRRARNVILISEAVRPLLPPAPSRRVWSIPNPVADSFFDVSRRTQRGRVFCSSRITPLKNIVGLIRAFAARARRIEGAELRIGGTAEAAYLADCRAEAERLGVGARVSFLGPLSVDEVQTELSHAQVFALASFQENAPLSLAEAMAAGVPAVAARVGGVPEMIEDGASGLLVDPWDATAIGDSIARLLCDERLCETMGRRARELARERHRASVVARRTAQVYRELLEG